MVERRRHERGASLVEFSIVALVFFIFVLGIFDFGRAILYYNMVSNAAREGARYGAIWSRNGSAISSLQICNVVVNATDLPGIPYPHASGCGTTGSGVNTLAVSVDRGAKRTLDVKGNETAPGAPVRVDLTYVFTPVTPLIGGLVGDTLSINAYSSMYVED